MSVLNRWFEEVWNQGRESAIDEMILPGAIVHGLTGPDGNEVVGAEGFKAMHRAFCAALSDIHVAVEEVVAQGDMSVARCVVTATHTGDGLGKAPKGNRVTFTGMTMARERDGKIVEGWNNFDFAAMFQQMD
jgi:predicted ester cyclase